MGNQDRDTGAFMVQLTLHEQLGTQNLSVSSKYHKDKNNKKKFLRLREIVTVNAEMEQSNKKVREMERCQ